MSLNILWLLVVILIHSCYSVWEEDATKKHIKHFDPNKERERPSWAGDLVVTYEKNTDPSARLKRRVKSVTSIVVPLNPVGRERWAPSDITGFFDTGTVTRHHEQTLNRGHVIGMALGGADMPDNIVPQYSEWQNPGDYGPWGLLEQKIRRFTMTKYGWGDLKAPTYSKLAGYGAVVENRKVTLTWNMIYDDTFEGGRVPIKYTGRYGTQKSYYDVSFPSTEAYKGWPPAKSTHHRIVEKQGDGIKLPKIPKALLKRGQYTSYQKKENNKMKAEEDNLKRAIRKNDLTDDEAAELQSYGNRKDFWTRGYKWFLIEEDIQSKRVQVNEIQLFVKRFIAAKNVDRLEEMIKKFHWIPLDTFVKTIKKKCPKISAYKFYQKKQFNILQNNILALNSAIHKYWEKKYTDVTTRKTFIKKPPVDLDTIIKRNQKRMWDYQQLDLQDPVMKKKEFDEMVSLSKLVLTQPISLSKSVMTKKADTKLQKQKEQLVFLQEKFKRLKDWRVTRDKARKELLTKWEGLKLEPKPLLTVKGVVPSPAGIELENEIDEKEENYIFEKDMSELHLPYEPQRNVHVYGTDNRKLIFAIIIIFAVTCLFGCIGFVCGGLVAYFLSTSKTKEYCF
eukprot:471665_1